MIFDHNSAYCCCIAALATLKLQYPVRIKDSVGEMREITYSEKNGTHICSCGNYFAYAILDEKDFSIHYQGISQKFTLENEEFLKILFKSTAKIFDGICGAQLYLQTKGDSNEKISAT